MNSCVNYISVRYTKNPTLLPMQVNLKDGKTRQLDKMPISEWIRNKAT